MSKLTAYNIMRTAFAALTAGDISDEKFRKVYKSCVIECGLGETLRGLQKLKEEIAVLNPTAEK